MGLKNICDGTGVEIAADTQVTGMFGHQYCDEARQIAEAYLAELNNLHTAMASKFQADLDSLREKYHEQLGVLPDEL